MMLMDKKRIELFISFCLIFIFVIAAVNGVKTITKRKQAVKVYSKIKQAQAAFGSSGVMPQHPPVYTDMQKQIQPQQIKDSQLGRDPFRRGVNIGPPTADASKDNVSDINLTGIIYDKQSPVDSYCIINGKILRLTDTVSIFKIIDINEDYIILSNENENVDFKLTIWKELEKPL